MNKKGFSPLKPVKSNVLKFIAYHKDDRTLLVRYGGGADWYYDNVPRYIYKELVDASKNNKASIGKLFLNLVKNNPDRPGRRVK